MLCPCQTPDACRSSGMCMDEIARGAKVTVSGLTASYTKRFSELTARELLDVHPANLERARAIERRRLGLEVVD